MSVGGDDTVKGPSGDENGNVLQTMADKGPSGGENESDLQNMVDKETVIISDRRESTNVNLRLALLNVQGLRTRRIDKCQSDELKNIFSNNDLVLLTETWADEYSNLSINGYTHFQLNRSEYKRNFKTCIRRSCNLRTK